MKKYIKPQTCVTMVNTASIIAASLPSNPDGPQIKPSRYRNKLWEDDEDDDWLF